MPPSSFSVAPLLLLRWPDVYLCIRFQSSSSSVRPFHNETCGRAAQPPCSERQRARRLGTHGRAGSAGLILFVNGCDRCRTLTLPRKTKKSVFFFEFFSSFFCPAVSRSAGLLQCKVTACTGPPHLPVGLARASARAARGGTGEKVKWTSTDVMLFPPGSLPVQRREHRGGPRSTPVPFS